MRYYEARSTIAASPEAVWAVLSDGAGWAAWDSGVDAVEGSIALGEHVEATDLNTATYDLLVKNIAASCLHVISNLYR